MQLRILCGLFLLICILYLSHANAVVQCIKLDPATVCTTSNDCYNVADCSVDCDITPVVLVGQCGSVSGTADVSTLDNVTISATATDNKYCWCKIVSPAVSKWVYRYEYSAASSCFQQCARGCRNAMIFNSATDISFRTVALGPLTD